MANVFGSGGQVFRQDPRDRRRFQLAQALQQQATDTSPVDHPLQAVARIGQGFSGALLEKRLNEKQDARDTARNDAIAKALQTGGLPVGESIAELPGQQPTESRLDAMIRALSESPETAPLALQLRTQQLTAGPGKRNITSDALGFKRDIDTGQRIFPDVEAKPDTLSDAAEAQRIRIAREARAQTTINVGQDGIDYGDPPKGMAWARNQDGSVALQQDPNTGFSQPIAIPVAGGPVEEERAAAETAAEARTTQTQRQGNIVVQDIDRALEKIEESPRFTTGPGGALLQDVPGTAARDVRGLIDTIRANVGFDRLNAMRQSSPTGGALGQVSEQENALLQATLGNLEQSQSADQLRENMLRVRETYLDIIHGPGNRPDSIEDDLTPEEREELDALRQRFGQ